MKTQFLQNDSATAAAWDTAAFPLAENISENEVASLQEQATAHIATGPSALRSCVRELVETMKHLMTEDKPDGSSIGLALVALSLAYVLCPVDAVPDFAPFIGWLDDLAVVSAALANMKKHLN